MSNCEAKSARKHFCINQCRVIPLSLLSFLVILAPVSADTNEPPEQAELFEMPIESLLEVEVTVASKMPETQFEAPGITAVVPRSEFEVYGDRDLHQLLQRQPSIYTRDVFPYTDNVAGFRGDMTTVADIHTIILFNGRPIRESAQGINVNMYKTFPLSVLKSVELVRGPGSVLYGTNAFTGVINLKPHIPEANETSISTMFGSHGYYDTEFTTGGRAGKFGHITALRLIGTQGYRYNMRDSGGIYGGDDTKYKSYSAATYMKYGNFTFSGFWSDYDAFAIGVVPQWSNPHQTFSNRKLFLNAGYRLPLHERATLEFNLTYNLQENSLTSYKPQIIGTNTSDFLGEATLFTNPLDNMNIIVGYLMEQRANYHPDKDKFQSIPSYRHEPKSLYAQGDYQIGKVVKLISAMQWNKSSQGVADIISRHGIIVTPNEHWGVKLLRGEAFRAPFTVETDLVDPGILMGNSDLEPEKITTYDGQIFYHDAKTHAAFTYFNSKIKDIIIYDYSVSPTSYINNGDQRFKGIEFEAKRFLTPDWHVLGSFMHQENEGDEDVNPTVVPTNMLKVGTAYKWDSGSLGFFYTHFGTPPRVDSSVTVNPKPDPVNLISMNLRLNVSKWLGLKKAQSYFTFKIENLLDEEIYVPTLAYTGSPNSFPYNAGRTFYFGLRIDF